MHNATLACIYGPWCFYGLEAGEAVCGGSVVLDAACLSGSSVEPEPPQWTPVSCSPASLSSPQGTFRDVQGSGICFRSCRGLIPPSPSPVRCAAHSDNLATGPHCTWASYLIFVFKFAFSAAFYTRLCVYIMPQTVSCMDQITVALHVPLIKM